MKGLAVDLTQSREVRHDAKGFFGGGASASLAALGAKSHLQDLTARQQVRGRVRMVRVVPHWIAPLPGARIVLRVDRTRGRTWTAWPRAIGTRPRLGADGGDLWDRWDRPGGRGLCGAGRGQPGTDRTVGTDRANRPGGVGGSLGGWEGVDGGAERRLSIPGRVPSAP